MQDQNFEKQVRQKMGELSLVPSPPVWNKVEEKIRKKKERRPILLWLLPLAVVSSLLIWWSLSPNEKSGTITAQKTESKYQNRNRNSTEDLKISNPKENHPAETGSNKEETIINEKSSFYLNEKKTKINNVRNRFFNSAHHSIKKSKVEKLSSAKIPDPIVEKRNADSTKINHAIVVTTNQNVPLVTDQNAMPKTINIETELRDSATAIEQMDAPKQQIKKGYKLKFGVTAQIGFSGITTGLFDGFGEKAAQDFASPTPVQNTSGGGAILPPSTIKRGFSYSLGFSVHKQMGSRSCFSSGLQYNYYSTKINVGSRSDSTSFNMEWFYRNDNQTNNYTNNFHFITLPFSYNYQVFKKLPVHFGAGLSLSKLLSSNALHYNSGANIYYKNNRLLNKTGAGIFTNLTYKLQRQKGASLNIGPQINYNLTPVQKGDASKRQHLFFIGLNTQLNL